MGRLQPTKAPCLVRQIVTSWTACTSSLKVWEDADGAQQLEGTAAASRKRSKAGQCSGGCAQKQLHDSCHMIRASCNINLLLIATTAMIVGHMPNIAIVTEQYVDMLQQHKSCGFCKRSWRHVSPHILLLEQKAVWPSCFWR
jgi:hypothetical protein